MSVMIVEPASQHHRIDSTEQLLQPDFVSGEISDEGEPPAEGAPRAPDAQAARAPHARQHADTQLGETRSSRETGPQTPATCERTSVICTRTFLFTNYFRVQM